MNDMASLRAALEAIVALPHGPERAALVQRLADSHAAILVVSAAGA